jgi:hypothetical protein
MAGGKETPRQKMIGMMYLVLTALLALNVSKEIINAFAKLDIKLMESNNIILNNRDALLGQFDAMMALPANKPLVKPWQDRALGVKKKADDMDRYINIDCKNELIKAVEQKDYVTEDPKRKGRFITISPMEIQTKDDYDAATRLFGGEPGTPGFAKGAEIREKILKYRDDLLMDVTKYNDGKRDYQFNPKNIKATEAEAMEKELDAECKKNVYAEDRDKVAAIYKMLTIPEKLKDFEEEVDWQLGMFDHAPIVAASALFTALSNDVRNAEVKAIEILVSRVKVPTFNFNKIDPLAFARTSYINQGDSLILNVKVAAYDSTEVNQIKYGMDADTTNEANWKEVAGSIKLDGSKTGVHYLRGKIGVKEKGEVKWKPWKFTYEVGAPTAVIANADLNVLYVGLDNKIEATASGYPADKISLTGGASISKSGEFYIVKPSPGQANKMLTLSVSGKNDDGSSKSLGSKEFKVRRLPVPLVFVGTANNTSSSIKKTELARGTVTAAYDASVPLNAKFSVNGFTMVVAKDGVEKSMKSNSGSMTGEMKSMVQVLKPGATVSFKDVRISGPGGNMAGPAMSFTVK